MLGEFGDRLIVAEQHRSDVMDIPWTQDRGDLYGVVALPRVWFDGLASVGSVLSCSQAASEYRAAIQARLVQNGGLSPVEITGAWEHDDENVTLTATFRKLDAVALPDLHAQLLLLENDIPFEGLVYRHVTRAAYDQPVVLNDVGDSVVVTVEVPLEEIWDPAQLEAIAFLQTLGSSKEIYQSARLPARRDFTFAFGDPIAGVPDGTGLASFHGVLTNPTDREDTLTVRLEQTFGWLTQFRVEGEEGYHGSPSIVPLGPGASRAVDLRAITDDARRVGTEHLDLTSARSGRTHRARARIFNRSPAILLVDDDRSGSEELDVEAALDARGYLYDVYDLFLTHIDEGPSAARMSAYDVVLWHTGWSSYDLIPAGDVAALTSYTAGGGALLLSSQDCLSEMAPGAFTHDVLGLDGWTVNVGADAARGAPGDPIGDGIDAVLEYETGLYNHADALAPASTAAIVLRNEDARPLALRNDNGTARSVFLAFGVNAMRDGQPDPSNAATLLDRSIRWLTQRSDVAVPDTPATPGRAPLILAIAPNPAGAGAARISIRLRLPGAAVEEGGRLDVFDLAGRCVRRLVASPNVLWDGRDGHGRRLSPGPYWLELTTRDGRDHARLILVR